MDDAYPSIDRLSREQWWLGGLLRSMHRYAADLFALVVIVHLVREWALGRFRGHATSSWLTGVVLLPLLAVSAIGGFWLNWDQLGHYSAVATAELLDWWPFFASPLTRNFLAGDSISDRLFSLFVFIHIGVPLLMLFGLWFHLHRLAHVAAWPPTALRRVVLGALVLMALIVPIQSHAPVDPMSLPESLRYDWVLLFVHPLVEATSAATVWFATLCGLGLLFALPLFRDRNRPAVAVVHPEHCSGCQRCVADCPYDAITMVPHPVRRGFSLAEVDADACASCAICVGSCPSSTPFRSMAELVTGIDIPSQPIDGLRRALRDKIAGLDTPLRFVVFGCEPGVPEIFSGQNDVTVLSLVCLGQLPPAFVEFALRDGADGVMVAMCPESGCAYRLGERWTELRLTGDRPPWLRESVDRSRIEVAECARHDVDAWHAALSRLRERVKHSRSGRT